MRRLHSRPVSERATPCRSAQQQLTIPGQRINVVGTCGSGKTSVGAAIAKARGCPFIELDALAWLPGWTNRPEEELRHLVEASTRGSAWVVDGNCGSVRNIVWQRADTVVWLDYKFLPVFVQLLRRTIRRARTREALSHGNRESFRLSFMSRDSILIWAIRTHPRRKRQYSDLLSRAEHAHLTVIRLRSPAETRRWLNAVARSRGSAPAG